MSREEYSYFRAEGLSLSAIRRVERSLDTIRKIEKSVCRMFSCVDCRIEKDSIRIQFPSDDQVPTGWLIVEHRLYGTENGISNRPYAVPPVNSRETLLLQHVHSLVAQALSERKLEDVFACGNMPEKSLPGGHYSDRFVQQQELKEQTHPAMMRREGYLTEQFSKCTYSSSACIKRDNLTFLEIGGEHYIRVPNGADGKPAFLPPEAEPIPLSEMLDIDRSEYQRRQRRMPGHT